jgi:hypothetical protein
MTETFKIKLEHEEIIEANNSGEAEKIFWKNLNQKTQENKDSWITELIEVEKTDEAKYTIPSMIITKDDLKTRFEGKDDEKETNADIDLIPSEDMKWIAYRMSDKMMENYWDALEEAYEDLKEHKIHEEQKNV